MRLKDRVAIVTGGSGIGKAYSLGLAKEGAKVVIADIKIEVAEKTAAEIGSSRREIGRGCTRTDKQRNGQ